MRTRHNKYIDGRTENMPLLLMWHSTPGTWSWEEFQAWAEPRYFPGAILVRPDTDKPAGPDNALLADCATRCIAGKVRFDNSLGYKGVSWSESRQKYEAYISVDGKRMNLGRHEQLEDAVAARQAAEKFYYPQVAA